MTKTEVLKNKHEALEENENKYIGLNCRNNHGTEEDGVLRYCSTDACVICMITSQRKYKESHKEEIRKRQKEKYHEDVEKSRNYAREWRENRTVEQIQRVREREHLRYEKEKVKMNTQRVQNHKEQLKTDSLLVFKEKIRTMIKNTMVRNFKTSKKNTKIATILGCTPVYFRSYIESKFTDGMCWENYGEWELDHIIPISKARTEEEVLKLSHHTNFQPLWSAENKLKSTKSMKVFQILKEVILEED